MGNRLYVGNLSFSTTEDAIERHFQAVGEVAEVKLVIDRESGRSRGFAFVSMATDELAKKAIQELDGSDLDQRPLRVNEAEDRPPRSSGGGFGGGGGGGGRGRGGFGGGGGGGGGRGRR